MKKVLILAVIYQVVSGLPKVDYNFQAPSSLADSQGSPKIIQNDSPSNRSQSLVDFHTTVIKQSEIPTSSLKKDRKSEVLSDVDLPAARQASPTVTTATATTVLDTTTTKTLLDRIKEMFQQSRKKFEESFVPVTTTQSTAATTQNAAATTQNAAATTQSAATTKTTGK